MRKIIILIISLLSLSVKAQTKIVGRVLDYEENWPINNIMVFVDSVINDSNHGMNKPELTNDSGYFQVNCNNKSPYLQIEFRQAGFQPLIIKNIPNQEKTTINLNNIYMFGGSYNWDGICQKKYLWGLIKKKKRCSGYVKGIVEESKNKTNIRVNYPKSGKEKNFNIEGRTLVIDYNEI